MSEEERRQLDEEKRRLEQERRDFEAQKQNTGKKKKGGCLKWALVIFGVLILFGACTAMFTDEESTDTADESTEEEPMEEETTDTNNNEEENLEEDTSEDIETDSGEQDESSSEDEEVVEEEEAEEVVGIGETLVVDDIEFTVNDWYQQDVVGDVLTSTANDTYLILDVSVTNNQNEAAMMMSSYFKIVEGERVFEPDTSASTYANQSVSPDNLGLLAEEINPGSSRNALIVYDITQDIIDSDNKELQVQSGIFGTQTGIINLQ